MAEWAVNKGGAEEQATAAEGGAGEETAAEAEAAARAVVMVAEEQGVATAAREMAVARVASRHIAQWHRRFD